MNTYTIKFLFGIGGLLIIIFDALIWNSIKDKTFRKKLTILGIFLLGIACLTIAWTISLSSTEHFEVLQKWEICGEYENQTELWDSIKNREFYILVDNFVNKLVIDRRRIISTKFGDVEKPKLLYVQNYRLWEGEYRSDLYKEYIVLLPERYKDAYLLWCEENLDE